ncbi:MAG: ECF-type sigma factor [Candidatus Omnitrophica bacterium]|nr:ECF-type sigma factor [Candidatus Omnitrophota bacterium]MDD5488293.1 ECF-type sigma factor [Candidatus Omnitrophota bacterium]
MPKEKPQKKQEQPVMRIIQNIHDGKINPATLSKEERQECVEALQLEGYSNSQMAKLLGRSEKTIKRDLDEIRQKNAIVPNMELACQLVGELLKNTRSHVQYLIKLSRQQGASVSERAQAIYYASRLELDTIAKLQTLGYMPMAPQKVVGDIYHHGDATNGLKEEIASIQKQMEELSSYMSDDEKEELADIKEGLTILMKEDEDEKDK